MKKTAIVLTAVLLVAVLAVSMVGCKTLDRGEGLKALDEAYANTRDNFNDIYQYSEKIYDKAVVGKDGSIINRTVNVNCAVDKHYNLLKDVNYAISVHEDKYLESVDSSAKLTNKQIAANDIVVGETTVSGDKSKAKVDALFVDSWTNAPNVSCESHNYEKNVKAKDFYASEYFIPKQLMNKQIMQEIALLNDSNMNFDIEKGGIKRTGRVTDYTFKMTDDYLRDYEATTGNKSLLDGKRVWLQTSYGRIANVYVYKDENLGAGLTAEYESYVFMITYLGKIVEKPKVPASSETKPSHVEMDIFDGAKFAENILSPVIG